MKATRTKIALVPETSSKVHSIDKGTSYDVAQGLHNLADAIEKGHFGRVTDVGLVMKSFNKDGLHINVKHVGMGGPGDLMLMAERFRQRAAQ